MQPGEGGVRELRAQQQRASRPGAKGDNGAFDPYGVLGINREASLEAIREAYRREMVNYHPDKVAHLGKELQELAKTKPRKSTGPTKHSRNHSEG